MSKFTLRKHQKKQNKKVLKELKSYDHVIYGAPTGFGKSVVALKIIEKWLKKGKRVILMAPRIELVHQLASTCASLNPVVVQGSILEGGDPSTASLIVTIPQTANRRLELDEDYFGDIDLVIVDEVHLFFDIKDDKPKRAVYNIHSRFWHTAKWIGFSATPITPAGKRLNGWDTSVYKYDTKWLIDHGWLAKFNYYADTSINTSQLKIDKRTHEYRASDMEEVVNTASSIHSVYKAYKKYCVKKDGIKKTMIFAASIAHAELITNHFIEKGIDARVIHSKLGKRVLKSDLLDFRRGVYNIVVNVDMLTTGFDDPSVEALLLARPVGSIRTAIQIYGRVLRIHDDIPYVDIIDLCNVHKTTLLPDDRVDWNKSSDDTDNGNGIGVETQQMQCNACEQVFGLNERKFERKYENDVLTTTYFCPHCGSVIDETNTELIDVSHITQLKTSLDIDTSVKYDNIRVVRDIIIMKNTNNTFVKETNPNFSYYIDRSCRKTKSKKKRYDEVVAGYMQGVYDWEKAWKILKDLHFEKS